MDSLLSLEWAKSTSKPTTSTSGLGQSLKVIIASNFQFTCTQFISKPTHPIQSSVILRSKLEIQKGKGLHFVEYLILVSCKILSLPNYSSEFLKVTHNRARSLAGLNPCSFIDFTGDMPIYTNSLGVTFKISEI